MKKLIFLLLLALPFFGFSQAAYLMEFTNPNGSKVVFNLNDVRSCVAEGTGSFLFTRTGSGKTQVQESPATIATNSCGNIVLFTVYSPANQFNDTKQMGVNPNYVVGVVSNTSGNGVLKMITPTENFTTTSTYNAAVALLSICVSGGGGGGSLTNTYVGFGDGLNQLDGEAGFTYGAESNRLAVDTVKTKRISSKSGPLEILNDTKYNAYPNTRDDSGAPVNILNTDASGILRSDPVSSLAGLIPDSIYRIPNTSFFPNAAMFARIQNGRVVTTDGFYTAGDGGGANYLISASGTADGVRIFSVAGGRFATLLANEDGGINFRQCGASTSIADNAPKIQAAIDNFSFVYCFDNASFPVFQTIHIKSGLHFQMGQNTELRQTGSVMNLMLSVPGEDTASAYVTDVLIEGGILNANYPARAPTTGSSTYDEYITLFKKVKNFTIRDINIIRSKVFSLVIGDCANVVVDNVRFENEPGGLFVQGPANFVDINNISGWTSDDFVALAGANWVNNDFTRGDISDISIKNVFPETNPLSGTTGNSVIMWGGNNALGLPGSTFYKLKNITITGVYGVSDNASVIQMAGSTGTPGDPNTGAGVGGSFENISVSNVYGSATTGDVIVMSSDDMKKISFHNIFGNSTRAAVDIRDATITDVSFDGLWLDKTTAKVPFAVTNSSIDYLLIKNGHFNSNSATGWLGLNQINSGAKIIIEDSEFDCSLAGGGGVYLTAPSCDFHVNSSRFYNATAAITCLSGGASQVYFNDLQFDECIFGLYNIGSGTADVYPASVQLIGTAGAENNLYRTNGPGITNVHPPSENIDGIIQLVADYSLSANYAIGTRKILKNSNTPTGTINIFAASATIDGSVSVPVPPNGSISLLKTSQTTWTVFASSGIFLSAVGSTPNANAASLSSSTLNLQPASASFPGVVTTATQTFSGQKTINMASSGAVTQNLILDNTATAAVNSAVSAALSVAGVQRGEVRTTLTEIVGGGADYAKVEIKAQNGGALKEGITIEAKNAGVDNVSIWAGSDGALTTARRIVEPYNNVNLTGDATLAAGYSHIVLTGTQILTDAWTVTMPPSADMLDGEILTISNSIPGVTGATLQLTANSGQTLLGFTGTASFANTVGFADRRAIQLMFKSGGTWITLAQY